MTKRKTFYIKTFGCQANKADSERIRGYYHLEGYQEDNDWQGADEIIINTCSVRQRAEDRVVGLLHNISLYLQENEQQHPKIIVTGCMLHHGPKKLKRMLPIVDEFIPAEEYSFDLPSIRQNQKRAFVPISNGCNSFCTYCIVPYARGREKSRPMSDILAEVQELADQGYHEITLLGQNVNSFGLEKVGVSLRKMLMRKNLSLKDIPSNQSQYTQPLTTPPFVELLRKISKIDEIKIIRFISANPWDFHDELVEEIAQNKKIDRYVHLAVQSGSNSVLKRMNRGYTRGQYLKLIKKLRQADPDLVFGTDIIVGFPGESDAEFQQTVDLAKKVKWQLAFVNIYSPRPGTAAEKLYEDNIPHKVKKKRWEILDKMINKANLDNRPKVV